MGKVTKRYVDAAFWSVMATLTLSVWFPADANAQVATKMMNMVTGEVRAVVQHELWNWLAVGAFLISLVTAVITKRMEAMLGVVITGILCTFLVSRNDLLGTLGVSVGATMSGP